MKAWSSISAMITERRRIILGGLVQGLGFRPFVYRLAQQLGLLGWVENGLAGVQIEIQGEPVKLQEFIRRLSDEKPAHAKIKRLECQTVPCMESTKFTIRASCTEGIAEAAILPDLAPCDSCLQEMSDPEDRRYRYPFTNCTECGPRFSIIRRLPYDRANTSMQKFAQCESCRAEYTDPFNRRFHAEPNACPRCGPQLRLCLSSGEELAAGDRALEQAITALRVGKIVALKSVGGFQLLVDATNASAVARLRQKKRRPEKPLALLYPGLEEVERDCCLDEAERRLLRSVERPIVLLRARPAAQQRIAPPVAPHNSNLGVMLPCSPLHSLLAAALQMPLVATSGNLSGEPICRTNEEAFTRLADIADIFLVHDRAIVRALDDSVARVIDGEPLLLRRARGYAPMSLVLPDSLAPMEQELLAVGAQLKNTVAVCRDRTIYLSQHIGDLDSRAALNGFERTISDLESLYGCHPGITLHDLHPGYSSHSNVARRGGRAQGVQHHCAHFFSCLAEHAYQGPALGICWDGTGYGEDGTLRGGECLMWDGADRIEHCASLRGFPLPGGEVAIREPRRQALGLLYALGGSAMLSSTAPLRTLFDDRERHNLVRMLERNINTPLCTSIGRLFDAVAALLGLASNVSFEAQAAMLLESAAQGSTSERSYPFTARRVENQWQLDWGPMVHALLADREQGLPPSECAAAFHNTLAQMILSIAQRMGVKRLFLTGGVFQNKLLTERAVALLRRNQFTVFTHSQVPPNDGGIALGQIYFALCMARYHLESVQCV